jgi:hypothetical protein
MIDKRPALGVTEPNNYRQIERARNVIARNTKSWRLEVS